MADAGGLPSAELQGLCSSIHVSARVPLSDEVNHDLPGRLHHLEVKLKQLNTDLEKVGEPPSVLLQAPLEEQVGEPPSVLPAPLRGAGGGRRTSLCPPPSSS